MAEEKDIRKTFFEEAAGIKEDVPAPVETPITTPTATTTTETPQATATTEPKELSDAELLELLNKRNIKVTSLEDLKPKPTEEEIKAANEKRNNDKIAFGLSNGKIKKEDYEALIQAQTDKDKFLFSDFAKELKSNNPDISDDEIKEEWELYTLSNLEDNDFKKIQRKKELNELADYKLKNKFANYYNLDNEYAAYEQTQNQNAAFKQKLEASVPVYQKDVAAAIEKLRTQKFVIEDAQHPENNFEGEFSYSDEDLKQLQDALLSKDQILSRIQNGYTLESIIDEGDMFLFKQNRNKFINKSAKDYNSKQYEKYSAGRHGIIPKKELIIADAGDASTVKTTFWSDVLPKADTAQPSVAKQ